MTLTRRAAAVATGTTLSAESGTALTWLTTLRLAAAAALTMGATTTTAAMTLSVAAILIEASTCGTEREVGRLAFWSVTFGARQLRANERAMDGPVVLLVVRRDLLGFDGFVCRSSRGQLWLLLLLGLFDLLAGLVALHAGLAACLDGGGDLRAAFLCSALV